MISEEQLDLNRKLKQIEEFNNLQDNFSLSPNVVLNSPRRPFLRSYSQGSLPPVQKSISRIGNYKVEKTVGKGKFGKVKTALHRSTGERVSIKVIKKRQLDKDHLNFINREVEIMKQLNHPNIIKLLEVIETEKVLLIVMEYASGGELMDFIATHGKVQEVMAQKFVAQIVSALTYIHKNNTVHRDLKAENLLLDEDLNIKIIDFGLSTSISTGELLTDYCGSPTYTCPEIIKRKPYDGFSADIWSLGIVLYLMVCGHLPFTAPDMLQLYSNVMEGNFKIPDFISDECADLLKLILKNNPKKRATLNSIIDHKWLLNRTLKINRVLTRPIFGNADMLDKKILKKMQSLGYDTTSKTLLEGIADKKTDDAFATYMILWSKSSSKYKRIDVLAEVYSSNDVSTTEKVNLTAPITLFKKSKKTHRRNRTADAPCPVPPESFVSEEPDPEDEIEPPIVHRTRSSSMVESVEEKIPKLISAAPITRLKTERRASIASGASTVFFEHSSESSEDDEIEVTKLGKQLITSMSEVSLPKKMVSPKKSKKEIYLSPDVNVVSNKKSIYQQKSPVSQMLTSSKYFEDNQTTPRIVRFPVNVEITSSKTPQEIVQNIRSVLFKKLIILEQKNRFTLSCEVEGTLIEIEVCQIPRLSIYGVRFHRLKGDVFAYKKIVDDLIPDISLAT